MKVTKHSALIAQVLAILKKRIADGQYRIPRTPIGGDLERDYQYNGYGKGLTGWIREACRSIPGANVVKEKGRVYVVYTA
jgi:hypothetical protein